MQLSILRLLILLVLVSIISCQQPVQERESTQRPNIIVILSDDMGYSDIGCYGGEINTPVLDGLAANGLRFTQFYNTARCCPARASLLTGLYPHQAGVGHMMEDHGTDSYSGDLSQHAATIAEVLKMTGYRTYMSGKWHVTPHKDPGDPQYNWPLQRGFDRFFGTIHGAGSFYDPNSLTSGNELIVPHEGFYYTDAISDTAVYFIQQNPADQPFFMYVAYTAAHWPMHALPEDIAKYEGRYDEGWDTIRAERYQKMMDMGLISPDWPMTPRDERLPIWEEAELPEWEVARMEVYAAMVDRMDQGIGKIVSALEETGNLDNTVIMYLQDNGGCAEGMRENGEPYPPVDTTIALQPMEAEELQMDMIPQFTRDGKPVKYGKGITPGPADTYVAYGKGWANVSNTPFRMYKHWVHEGGISTPLIVHWPAGIQSQGELRNQPGHLIDIMASCVDLAEATYPEKLYGNPIKPMEGKSLVPAFNDQTIDRTAIYWEHEGNRAIRQGKWKLISSADFNPFYWWGTEEIPENQWGLYDLEADRSELNNLSADYPEKVAELSTLWLNWASENGVIPHPER